MENGTIFLTYLIVWPFYLLGIHVYAHVKKLNQGWILLSHSVPSLVAVVMAWIFLISDGATVAQFAAGSESTLRLWSLWFDLWPKLLLATFITGLVQFFGTFVLAIWPQRRKWIPVTLVGAVMSAFALMTVLLNFPDA